METSKFLEAKKQELHDQKIVYLRIKVLTNASQNGFGEILETEEPTLKIRITQKPEQGKANQEVEKFLGKHFNAQCQIISGKQNTIKLVKLFF